MMTKRNLAMMITIIFVVLALFLSSVVLKEYFNDYDVNHASQSELIERVIQNTISNDVEKQQIYYIGTETNGYYRAMKEWTGYRKFSFQSFSSFPEINDIIQLEDKSYSCLLVDGQFLENNTESLTDKLLQYVTQGGIVIFYRLPSYQTISKYDTLKYLLGIQHMRGESVKLKEIRLYSGFLLGGETCYSFEDVDDPKLVDMERNIPWYDISSRTKSYMVGFLTDDEKNAMDLENEDMPAILWRSNLENGSVFAVNGDYMKGEAALGILDAMLYESKDYALYSVVNAQNLSVAGFPDLTDENEKTMSETYGMTTTQFCRDILWPSLVAGAQKGQWKITSYMSTKQSDNSKNDPHQEELIDYLKYYNEESAEMGISLGRKNNSNIRFSISNEKKTLKNWDLNYIFTGGYVRQENKNLLSSLIDEQGKMLSFNEIRTVVGEYENDQKILSWLSDQITVQNMTSNAYQHSYMDSLRLKSIETALAYSNIQVDMYRVLWPESQKDEWQSVAEKMAANIDTYWKPFAIFDKTTISQSDTRVRNFLNGDVKSVRNGNQISIDIQDFTGDGYFLLRTHGEKIKTMVGGSWQEVEEDTYLLQLSSSKVVLTVEPKIQLYYQDE